MLHRVRPKGDLSSLYRNRNIEITTEQLDELITWVKASGYRIVSLKNIVRNIETKRGYRQCVFTFDDGYRDNLTHALPIFEKHDAPLTVFLTTNFIDKKLQPWWYALEGSSITDKEFETILPRILEAPWCAEHEIKVFGTSLDKHSLLTDKTFLDWEEVRLLGAHSLIEIGAHTVSHQRLSALGSAELWREVRDCKMRIEEEIGGAVEVFAYPFGDAMSCGSREFLVAEKSGYSASVTTRIGNVCSGHRNFLHCLPRIPIEGVDFSIERVALAMSGFPLLRQHKLNPMAVQ
jgi:peptidoglycan/xylan/chitin deacetylase (PgdA/CDA1 family)